MVGHVDDLERHVSPLELALVRSLTRPLSGRVTSRELARIIRDTAADLTAQGFKRDQEGDQGGQD